MAKFELDADFNDSELETLLDSLDEWESQSAELLNMIDKLRKMGDPPDGADEDYKRDFGQFRDHILGQEQKAKKDKKVRREKATLLKAKVILLQQRSAIERLGDPNEKISSPSEKPRRPRHPEVPEEDASES